MQKIRVNALSYSIMMRMLYDHPCTYEELHQATGLAHSTIRDHIKALVKQHMLTRGPMEPSPQGAYVIKTFSLRLADSQRDVPKPRLLTGKERSAKYRKARQEKKVWDALTACSPKSPGL